MALNVSICKRSACSLCKLVPPKEDSWRAHCVQGSEATSTSQTLVCPITDSAGSPYGTLHLVGGEIHAKRYGPESFSGAEAAAVEEFAKHVAAFLETVLLTDIARPRRGTSST